MVDWIERIPFAETRSYVQRVMENYQVYKMRLSGQFDIADRPGERPVIFRRLSCSCRSPPSIVRSQCQLLIPVCVERLAMSRGAVLSPSRSLNGHLDRAFPTFSIRRPTGLNSMPASMAKAGGVGLPVICLPGLTRNARDFHDLALKLSRDAQNPRKVVAFDYRGRGQSAYDPNWKNYDVIVEAGDIVAGLTVLGIEHGAFIGTSRGGLIIHVLAAMRPTLLKAVVLNDMGPVLEGEGLAHIRAYLEKAPKPKRSRRCDRDPEGGSRASISSTQRRGLGAVHPRHLSRGRRRPRSRFRSCPAEHRERHGPDASRCRCSGPQFEGLAAVPMLASAAKIQNCFPRLPSRKWPAAIRTARRSRSKARATRRCSKPETCRQRSPRS